MVQGTRRPKKGLTDDQIAVMRRESDQVGQQFKRIEKSYSADNLDLVLAKGYVVKLLANARIVRYLAQNHAQLLAEFQKIADFQRAA